MDIKRERKKVGISQHELGHKTGLGRYKIYLYENGYANITINDIQKIKTTLKIAGAKNATR